MKEIKSILNGILQEVNKETDVNKIKELFIKRVTESKIKGEDKRSMLKVIQYKKNYFEVIKYIYDCLLKYEGDGVVNESLNGGKLK